MKRKLTWGLFWLLSIVSFLTVRAQQSPNTVKYRVTYDATTQTYTAWAVPDYATPNTNNGATAELVSTAQFTLKVPIGFTISNITDASGTQIWDKNPAKLGPGLSLTATNGTTFTQNYSPAALDPAYAYYVLGKSPSESNLGAFVVGQPVALFTFKGNGCFGPIQPLAPGDPFIQAALDAYSFNVANSFYSASGQPAGGNQIPLEQFANITGPAASCYLPPMATPDIANTRINTPVPGNVLNNDNDPQGQTLTTTLISPPPVGTVSLNPDGSYVYTPPTNFTGTTTFCYKATNTAGLSSTACATINVLPDPAPVGQNNPPVPSNDATQTTMGTPVKVVVLANDTDPDSSTSSNGQLNNPTLVSQPSVGFASVNPDGSITYTPPTGFTGVVTFPYQVCDKGTPPLCATALVTVDVQPTPPAGTPLAPVAVDDALLTRVNVPKQGTVASNDSDPQNLPLTYTSGQPQHGTVAMNPDGSYTYTPTTGYAGPDSFTYTVCNSANKCDKATVTIVVQPETVLPPLATPDIANTRPNTPVPGNVSTNDNDPQNQPLTFTLITPPPVGTVSLNPDGSYIYTPPTNFTGTTVFCYKATNTSGLSSTACVTVNVNPDPAPAGTNNTPVANPDATQTTAGTPVKIVVLGNDTDPDSSTSPNGQLNTPTLLGQPPVGTASVNPDGSITYTPPTGFTGVVTFPYQVCDKGTPPLCATALVTVNVQPTPPAGTILPPVAVDDALLTPVNTPKQGTVASNDSDPQNLPLTYTSGQPSHGTVAMNPDGSYTYTPTTGYSGPDSFTYTVCNSANKCDKATVSILVQPQTVVGTVSGYVWNDTNKDGLQTSGETGVAGVTVTLYNATTSQPVSSVVTDASGHYVFSNVSPGSYYVQFTTPAGKTYTTPNVGANDAIDSDAGSNGQTAGFTLTQSQTTATQDAGLIPICPTCTTSITVK
ncbi:Ig-like domain-containing protein [Spirosoma aerolatum]|uniref:Ig-like domain-containing protein n=1 Tax=Spirosoma aerolatum TaxID=1211326 RepID=UPI0009AEE58F|nr:Ig-like domain-containing protein [Spirosoma aerolatum]